MTTHPATHYKCSRCGKDAEVCPRRQNDLDVWLRAVRTFERAGTFDDGGSRSKTYKSGDGLLES